MVILRAKIRIKHEYKKSQSMDGIVLHGAYDTVLILDDGIC
jgi:hypothetical protein